MGPLAFHKPTQMAYAAPVTAALRHWLAIFGLIAGLLFLLLQVRTGPDEPFTLAAAPRFAAPNPASPLRPLKLKLCGPRAVGLPGGGN